MALPRAAVAVAGDDVDPLHGRVRQAAVFDHLHDEGPEGLLRLRRRPSLSSFSASERWSFSGMMATVLVWASSMYSCMASSIWGGKSLVSPVYHTGSPAATTSVHPGQQADRVGPLVEQILAADGLDGAALAAADGHGHPVAVDQPPDFVDDGVGRLAGVEAGVDRAGELLDLRPQGLAVGECRN